MEGLFGLVPEAVLCHPELNGTDVRVYAVLAMRAGACGFCWPSLRDLEVQTHVSRSSVSRATNKLEAFGFIFREYHDDRLVYLMSDEVFNRLFNRGVIRAPPGCEMTRGGVTRAPPGSEMTQGGVTRAPPGVETAQENSEKLSTPVSPVRPGKTKERDTTHARTDSPGDRKQYLPSKALPTASARGARVGGGGGPDAELSTGEPRVEIDPAARVQCKGVFARFAPADVMVSVPDISPEALQKRMDQINRKAARGLNIKDPIGYLVSSFLKPWVNQ